MRLLEGIIYNIYTYYSVRVFQFLYSLVTRVCTIKLCWEATEGAPESCVRGPLTFTPPPRLLHLKAIVLGLKMA